MEQHTEDKKRATERSERRRANAEYYKKLGRCPVCGRKDAKTDAVGGWCFDCLEKEREKRNRNKEKRNQHRIVTGKRLYEERKRAGLCTQCGKPIDGTGLKCKKCAAVHRERAKDKWIASGKPTGRWETDLCGRCMKRQNVPGYKLCEECLEKQREMVKRRKSCVPGPDHPWRHSRFAYNFKKNGDEISK